MKLACSCDLTAAVVAIRFAQFFRFHFNALLAIEYSVLTWVGVCLVVVQIINDTSQLGVPVMMFVMSPLIGLLSFFTIQRRRRLVAEAPLSELTSENEFELRARQVLERYTAHLRHTAQSQLRGFSAALTSMDSVASDADTAILAEFVQSVNRA